MNDRATRLAGFLEEWRERSGGKTLRRRLPAFLERAAPLLASTREALSTRGALAPPKLDAADVRVLASRLIPALRRAGRAGASGNPWSLAGLGRREVRNARVLAGLWSSSRPDDLAMAFLAQFFGRITTSVGATLPDTAELGRGYRVRTEHCLDCDGADRIDLIVETANHVIGIEIKIDAGEGDRQLDRYVAAIGRSQAAFGRKSAVILLGRRPPSRPDVLWANWSMLRAAAMAAMPRRRSDHGFDHELLIHFVRHVRAF